MIHFVNEIKLRIFFLKRRTILNCKTYNLKSNKTLQTRTLFFYKLIISIKNYIFKSLSIYIKFTYSTTTRIKLVQFKKQSWVCVGWLKLLKICDLQKHLTRGLGLMSDRRLTFFLQNLVERFNLKQMWDKTLSSSSSSQSSKLLLFCYFLMKLYTLSSTHTQSLLPRKSETLSPEIHTHLTIHYSQAYIAFDLKKINNKNDELWKLTHQLMMNKVR